MLSANSIIKSLEDKIQKEMDIILMTKMNEIDTSSIVLTKGKISLKFP